MCCVRKLIPYCSSQVSGTLCPQIPSLVMHDLCSKNGLHGQKTVFSHFVHQNKTVDVEEALSNIMHAIYNHCGDFTVFMWACLCMQMCMHAHLCARVWRSEVSVGCLSLVVLYFTFETVSHWTWSLLVRRDWLASKFPDFFCIFLSSEWTRDTSCSWVSYLEAGNWTQVLRPKQQICHWLNCFLNPPFKSWVFSLCFSLITEIKFCNKIK